MTKLRAPLFSGTAVGSVGGILSFSRHHGLNTGSKKATPKDPSKEVKDGQRDTFQAGAAMWHLMNLAPRDLMAWNTLGENTHVHAGPYACFLKYFLPTYKRGETWVRFRNMQILDLRASSLRFTIDAYDYAFPIWGARVASAMSGDNYVELTLVAGDTWECDFGSLTRNKGFHFYVYSSFQGSRYGRSGLYWIKTPLI